MKTLHHVHHHVLRIIAKTAPALAACLFAFLPAANLRADNADTNTTATPKAKVIATAAGDYHSLFLTSDGKLWAMGDNSLGQLGDGTTTDRGAPIQVATNVTAIAAGGYQSMYVTADGKLWKMGYDASASSAAADIVCQTTPVQVASNVTSVTAGAMHSLYVTDDGKLWSMGDNSSGQLGNGTTASETAPVQVPADADVTLVVAGAEHSLYITDSGDLWAIGDNASGQLGNPEAGLKTSAPIPVVAAAAGDIAPVFTVQPTDQSKTGTAAELSTATVTFTALATGFPAPTYQWQYRGTSAGTWQNMLDTAISSGATTNTLVLASNFLVGGSYWQFRCIATNIIDSAISNTVTLHVTITDGSGGTGGGSSGGGGGGAPSLIWLGAVAALAALRRAKRR